MALIGVHRLQGHAALVLDGFLRHLLGQVGQGLLPLAAVVLGIHTDVHVLVAAAVDHIVGQVLDGVQSFAPAADDSAHAAAGEIDVDAAVVAGADLNVRLDIHALQQTGQKAADRGVVGVLVHNGGGLLGLHRGRCGLRLLLLLYGCRLFGGLGGGGRFGLLLRGLDSRLVLGLVVHANHGRDGADPQEAGLRAGDDLVAVAHVVLVQAQFSQGGLQRFFHAAAGFFQRFDHSRILLIR